jgi:uncharacterized protein (TIGR03435 family)
MRGGSAMGQTSANSPVAFEVISIKQSGGGDMNVKWEPGRFTAANISVERLIDMAYGLRPEQLNGLPAWGKDRTFIIEAVTAPDAPSLGTPQANRRLLQSMLSDRFALQIHSTVKQLPVYEMAVAKGGPKFGKHVEPPLSAAGQTLGPGVYDGGASGSTKFVDVSMQFLSYFFSARLGRTVIDKTALTGSYDFTLDVKSWSLSPVAAAPGAEVSSMPSESEFEDSIFASIQEQLGLKLKSSTGPVTVWVVDHIETPAAN